MKQVTEIEYITTGNKIDMWWGNEDQIFGELKIALADLEQWIEASVDTTIVVCNNPYGLSGPDHNPPGYYDKEYTLSGQQYFEEADYKERTRLIKAYLKDHKLIA
jgi:hypothetical protein